MSEYVFDNKAPEAGQRFGALETLYDPLTIRYLEPLVQPGHRCLEVGAGSGTIAHWMSESVGPSGEVLATDINTRFLAQLGGGNLRLLEHNIASDELPHDRFDLAHTRLVLIHLPDRERAIEHMVAALKPGGWVVLQEFDALSMHADPAVFPRERTLKTFQVLQSVMAARGVDAHIGRRLLGLMEQAGLEDVRAEGHMFMHRGGSPGADLFRANFEQMKDALLENGLTAAEFEADVKALADPSVVWPSQVMWTGLGRKPAPKT
jgi:ubiquinone/menaquinone biosynthesis C-methylase UbiE